MSLLSGQEEKNDVISKRPFTGPRAIEAQNPSDWHKKTKSIAFLPVLFFSLLFFIPKKTYILKVNKEKIVYIFEFLL